MQRIETRTQLINFICEDIRQYSIVRACHHPEGSVHVMGGFSRVPPSEKPGWIVSITSVFGRTWLVVVTPHDHQHIFKSWITDSLPWEYYIGKLDRGEDSIYDGDNPGQARLARDMAIKVKEWVK